MKALVTGGAGFIGSHLCDALLARGDQVLVIDNLSRGLAARLDTKVQLYTFDVGAAATSRLIAAERPDAIFHLAAQIDVRHSVARPDHDAQINILGTLKVAQAAAAHGVGCLVFASTGGAIYGEQQVFPAPESHPCRPLSPYGLAKAAAERYLDYFSSTSRLRCVSLRYSNVYGPRQDPHGEAGVVAIFAAKLLAGEVPTIYGDGRQTRDFVYVEDVVRANLLACDNPQATGVFNIGTGQETAIRQVYGVLAAAARGPPDPHFARPRPGEQQRSAIDAAAAAARLHWRPQQGLEPGLRLTLQHMAGQASDVQAATA